VRSALTLQVARRYCPAGGFITGMIAPQAGSDNVTSVPVTVGLSEAPSGRLRRRQPLSPTVTVQFPGGATGPGPESVLHYNIIYDDQCPPGPGTQAGPGPARHGRGYDSADCDSGV
jgi:hypothetical protein